VHSRKQELLDALIRYLVRHGLADLSLRPMAAEAGTSARLLIFHFGSKEKLLVEVLNEMQARLQQSFSAHLAEGAKPPKMTLLQAFWDWATTGENYDYHRLQSQGLRPLSQEDIPQLARAHPAGAAAGPTDPGLRHPLRRRVRRPVYRIHEHRRPPPSGRRVAGVHPAGPGPRSGRDPRHSRFQTTPPIQEITMKTLLLATLAFAAALALPAARADLAPGSMDMHWDAGAEDCSKHAAPPIEVHPYNSDTYVLREGLCATWEAPFMYLLIGSDKALLIDTGDVADPKLMPLADTVLGLLPQKGGAKLPLIVVHSHHHLDHRRGDPQFQGLPGVTLVSPDLDKVQSYFGFKQWPQGQAQLDLGGRVVDVVPAPGHNLTHVVYYDRRTGILFAGDFIMPARLLVDDLDAYKASAVRVAAFVRDRPVSYVLGGHVEKDVHGQLFDWESTFHPDEAPLALGKADVLGLPAALDKFNGFYTETGGYVIMNPMHNLEAFAAAVLLVLAGLCVLVYRLIKRWRRKRQTA
jgi:hydroxyacylglutathione hydrolase